MSKNDCLLNIYTHNLMLSIFNKIFQTQTNLFKIGANKRHTKATNTPK